MTELDPSDLTQQMRSAALEQAERLKANIIDFRKLRDGSVVGVFYQYAHLNVKETADIADLGEYLDRLLKVGIKREDEEVKCVGIRKLTETVVISTL